MEHLIKIVGVGDSGAADGIFNAAVSRSDPPPCLQIAQTGYIVLKTHVHLTAEQVAEAGFAEIA